MRNRHGCEACQSAEREQGTPFPNLKPELLEVSLHLPRSVLACVSASACVCLPTLIVWSCALS